MYSYLTHPLDVIKTNRIVGSQISKEAGENLPREILALYERGMMQGGLYRGLAPAFGIGILWKMPTEEVGLQRYPAISLLIGTLLLNPLVNM